MTTSKNKAKPTKKDATLLGRHLSSQALIEGLVEGIPSTDFESIREQLNTLLSERYQSIKVERDKAEQYKAKVAQAGALVSQFATEEKVNVQDVISTFTSRDVLYVFPLGNGQMGQYKGRGQKPAALAKLIADGARLEDFAVSLKAFMD